MKKIYALFAIVAFLSSTTITSASGFSDIAPENPYYTGLNYLSEKGIVSGYADGTFGAHKEINRAELLKIFMESADIEITTPESNCFSDVPYTEWYASYVCTAKENGFVNGYTDGTFKPEKKVNKVEAIKMLGEIHGWNLEETKNEELFEDTPANAWYAPYIRYAKAKNFLKDTGTNFSPASNISRGSISESLYRVLITTELGEDKFSKELAGIETKEENSDTLSNRTGQTSLISGIITDALTGFELDETTVSLYDKDGNFIVSTESKSNGEFEIPEAIVYPSDYLSFSKNGYFPFQIPITKITGDIHISLSKTFTQIEPQDLRIVLTWGDSEVDLDAHLIDPDKEEIFFMHRINQEVDIILDVDSTDPNGTETITINNLETGVYEYFVHKYTGTQSFEEANARIEVYDKKGLAKIYYAPKGDNEIWQLFLLDEKGTITDMNTIVDCEEMKNTTSICPIQ